MQGNSTQRAARRLAQSWGIQETTAETVIRAGRKAKANSRKQAQHVIDTYDAPPVLTGQGEYARQWPQPDHHDPEPSEQSGVIGLVCGIALIVAVGAAVLGFLAAGR